MYTLTLTHGERMAVDWIAHRYRHGDELYRLLCPPTEWKPDYTDWDDEKDITFIIPEHVAWEIFEIIKGRLDCFSDEFKLKLYSFAEKVV